KAVRLSMSSGSPVLVSNNARSIWSRFSFHSEAGLIVAVAVVCLLTLALDSQHTYWRKPGPSAVDILRQSTTIGIFALGAALVIIAGGIDLSSGSVIAFSGAVCGSILLWLAPVEMKNNEPLPLAVIVAACVGALLSGFLVGTLHAWIITVVGLPPF